MADTPTLVQFRDGWEADGLGPDNLPMYRPTTVIQLDRPPYLSLTREATEEDIAEHPLPYALYEKTRQARKETSGYPLALWPAIQEAEFKMCAARDIYTVEQLAQLVSGKRKAEALKNVPPQIIELAERAAQLSKMHADTGQYEEIIRDLTGQLEAIREQFDEALKTVSAQKALIDSLRMKAAV